MGFEKKELKKIEQKPIEWHREDEQNLNACLGYIPDEFLRRWLTDAIHVKYDNPAWSEEDKEMLNNIIDYIKPMPIFFESTKGKSGKEYTKEFIKKAVKWLKSIKDRYTWKPSEEQMNVLLAEVND